MSKIRLWLSNRRLSTKLFFAVVLALLAAAAVFAVAMAVGVRILDSAVYGENASEQMADRQFEKLQSYVEREGITSSDVSRISGWTARNRRLYLTIYRDGTIQFESAGAVLPAEAKDFDESAEEEDRLYILTLADGVEENAYLYLYTSGVYYYWLLAGCGALAFLTFLLCFGAVIHRKFKSVRRLKQELDILAGGQLDYPVTVRGGDELGELASGIDEMRRSILAHQKAEDEMRSANSRLVTAMSHDLRTPLTALMAYLELLDRGKAADEEQKRQLIHRSLEQTMSIRSMADKLFEYFFVYASEWDTPELEAVDADAAMSQYWQEYAFSMESGGMTVELTLEPLGGSLRLNPEMLRRAFDNLYSNVMKYADPAQPVRIACRREGDSAVLTVSNAIVPGRDEKQGTNIGLGTCRRILQVHGGTFETREEKGVFSVTIDLPIGPLM